MIMIYNYQLKCVQMREWLYITRSTYPHVIENKQQQLDMNIIAVPTGKTCGLCEGKSNNIFRLFFLCYVCVFTVK